MCLFGRCQEVVSKCNQKISSFKRRKNKQDDECSDKVREFLHTAIMFNKLFAELSSAAPRSQDLKTAMTQVAAAGYKCSRVASMKLLKAHVFELVKYTRFKDVPLAAADLMNAEMTTPCDQEFFQCSYGLIIEQVVQKLLRTLPQIQLKIANPAVQHIKSFLDAVLQNHDLTISAGMDVQIKTLAMILAHGDKTILPNQVMQAVEQVRAAKSEERLYIAMKSLPQGGILLTEAESLASSRVASDKSLTELSKLTEQVEKLADADLDASSFQNIAELWEAVQGIEKEFQDKAEAANITSLFHKLSAKCGLCVGYHVDVELAAFLASQHIHATNKMKTLDFPQWKIATAKKFFTDDIFRHFCRIFCLFSYLLSCTFSRVMMIMLMMMMMMMMMVILVLVILYWW